MTPEPGSPWIDIRSGEPIKVKGITGSGAAMAVDYEGRTQAGWCRADAWERYFRPAEEAKERKAA